MSPEECDRLAQCRRALSIARVSALQSVFITSLQSRGAWQADGTFSMSSLEESCKGSDEFSVGVYPVLELFLQTFTLVPLEWSVCSSTVNSEDAAHLLRVNDDTLEMLEEVAACSGLRMSR